MKKVDLTSQFNIVFYDGHSKPQKIKRMLDKKVTHKMDSKKKQKILILQLEDGFTLTSFKIKGPPYNDYNENGQIKSGLLFVTKERPKIEELEKFFQFNEWDMDNRKIQDVIFPDLCFLTDHDKYTFQKNFRKGSYLKGNYVSFIFNQSYGSSEEWEISELLLVGYNSYIDIKTIGNEKRDHKIFKELLFNSQFSDFTFKIEKSIIPVHKSILSPYSKKFDKIFEKDSFELIGFHENILRLLLEYLYTQFLPKIEFEQVIELCELAQFFELKDLSEHCLKIFSESINEDNCFELFKSVILERNLTQFKDEFISFFSETVDELLFREEFQNLEKHTIIEVYRKRYEGLDSTIKKWKKYKQGEETDVDWDSDVSEESEISYT
eukprot:gene11468-4632_t